MSNQKATEKKRTQAKYPRHTLDEALKIPAAILSKNAGKKCTDVEASNFMGIKYGGPFQTQVGSAIKYGLLKRPEKANIELTEIAKSILKPHKPEEELKGRRSAIMEEKTISKIYQHYRGENLPDSEFLKNALNDKFGIPKEKLGDFIAILKASLNQAKLIETIGESERIIDISSTKDSGIEVSQDIKKLSRGVKLKKGDSCFVMMPFADPIGRYYSEIYEPAITKAGLIAVRADDDIFGTGKIMNQIWDGINNSKILIAELTDRNPNVFYELGLAHALKKPVILVSKNDQDVPFDLKHIRVIYYDCNDPFWGEKLIAKLAENIVSTLKDPSDAILFE